MESKSLKAKGGAQKVREKRSKELELAGRDPKQMKLSFKSGPVLEQLQSSEIASGSSVIPTGSEMVQQAKIISQPEASSDEELGHEECPVSDMQPSETFQEEEEEFVSVEELSEEHSKTMSSTAEQVTVSVDLESPGLEIVPSDLSFELPSSCSPADKIAFIEKHPFQPDVVDCCNIAFKKSDFYFRKRANGDLVNRSWLTCKVTDKKLDAFYCSICIAFSKVPSVFTTGCTNFRHCYQAVAKHEASKSHCEAATTYFTFKKERNLETLINKDLAFRKKKEVLQNIEVMKRIFDLVKLIGKQGLPFRAHGTNESLYNLRNTAINHGNFLEIILFLANYDIPMKNHIDKCVQESEKRKRHLQGKTNTGKASVGRGSLVTFLSYNTVKKVFVAIVQRMKMHIVAEIGKKRFSIQVDCTQDAGIVDQASIVVRYVKDEDIKERLIAVLPVKDASGRGLHELIFSFFESVGLNFSNIAGESFDGAANMRSSYVGLRAQISSTVPDSVYIWCYSHILNLCITDCCDVLEAKNFFGLLNRLATFIRDSHKRMNVWREQLEKKQGHGKLLRLQKIGQTRWWAKEKALNWLFGDKHPLYLDTIEVLFLVSQLSNCDSKTTSEATSLYEMLCDYKTILTAHIFLPIFDIIGPVSRYLQTSGIDFLVAWRMVDSAVAQLKRIDFSSVQGKAAEFAKTMNEMVTENDAIHSLEIKSVLPVKRVSRKKLMPGEASSDERPVDSLVRFKVEVFRPILDQILVSITERFGENKQLIIDCQYLDPRSFDRIVKDSKVLEGGTLKHICELARVDEQAVIAELASFANVFRQLTGNICAVGSFGPIIIPEDEEEEEQKEAEDDIASDNPGDESQCSSCNNCLICCHRLLLKHNLYSAAYENLSVVYEYLLTLSFTQVECERAFSKLKLIKTQLRSTMGQQLLDAFMMMSVERELLDVIQFSDVLEIIRESSTVLRSLLTM